MRSHPTRLNRWLRRILLLLVSAGWIVPAVADAQSSREAAYLLVDSNAPETTVYLDSVRLGTTETALWAIPPGRHLLGAVPTGVYSWSFEHKTISIEAVSGDTVRVSFRFPYTYAINSSPPEASVFQVQRGQRRKLGVTPLTFTSERPLGGMLVVEKMDFDTVQVVPGGELWNSYRVELVGRERSVAEMHVDLPRQHRERTWLSYMAAGLAVSAGTAAVYFQRRANRLRSSDNPHVRLRSHRFERLSSGSLVAMQLGVGVLAIQLVWD